MSQPKTIILITGANIGVGKAATEVIAQSSADYHVIMGSRSVEKGEAALREVRATNLKGTASLIQLDVTDDDSIAAAAKSVEQEFGRLDVLVNNAAIGGFEDPLGSRQAYLNVFNTNAAGAAMVTEAFQPLLLKSDHARIVFITSGQGSIARKLDPNTAYSNLEGFAYRMSKSAMNMLMAGYHGRLASKGVKIHAMCPGYVHTNLRRDTEPRPGTLPAETSGKTLLGLIQGDRDADVGKFVHNNPQDNGPGLYAW